MATPLPGPAARKPRPPRDGAMSVRVGAFELRKKGVTRYDWRDPYHIAVSLSWPGFLFMFLVLELSVNVLFALLYLAEPGSIANARDGVFTDAFFFSLETLATVGYGAMSPATLYGHVVSAVEIISGLAFIAIMTGITFVRFSRPRGKFLYAEQAVIATYNGRPTLMLRIANGRAGAMTDATARLSALISERTHEGQFYRRIQDLKLLRDRIPLFALTWTLMHVIDETSPLHQFDLRRFAESRAQLFLAVQARDPNLAAQVYDMFQYSSEQVAFGMRFADAVSIDEQGRTIADLARISLLEPDQGTSFAAAAE